MLYVNFSFLMKIKFHFQKRKEKEYPRIRPIEYIKVKITCKRRATRGLLFRYVFSTTCPHYHLLRCWQPQVHRGKQKDNSNYKLGHVPYGTAIIIIIIYDAKANLYYCKVYKRNRASTTSTYAWWQVLSCSHGCGSSRSLVRWLTFTRVWWPPSGEVFRFKKKKKRRERKKRWKTS